MAYEYIYPTGDVSVGHTPTPASPANNYSKVDDVYNSPDDATTYNAVTSDVDVTDKLSCAASTGEGTITNVRIVVRSYAAASASNMKTYLRTHSTDYEGSQNVLPADSTYHDYYTDYADNPQTTSEWTWSEIDAMDIGYRTYTQDKGSQTTQCYARVTYTEQTAFKGGIAVVAAG